MADKVIFKLGKHLGTGTFGTTYLANVIDEKRKKEWGEVVVIKIPLNNDKEKILIQEVILNNKLSELTSDNLVKYLGFDKFDGKYVMVMEFIDGETLRAKIGEIDHQQRLEITEALDITKQICRGLIAIHGCRVFHRDIKPDNIMITKNNIVKVGDFGISTAIKSSELASTTTGSLAYMPREILKGKGGFFYSDIYSLGVTLYEMITGELPFIGNNISELIDNICEGEPIPSKVRNKEIDDSLNNLIMKALDKTIEKRYQNAKEFLDAIEKYEKGSDYEIEEAWELFNNGQVTASEEKFKHIIKHDPANPKVYYNLGELYNRCQRNKEAISIYKKGIKVDSSFALLYRNLALSLSRECQKSEAKEYLLKAIKLGLDDKAKRHAEMLLEQWKRFS